MIYQGLEELLNVSFAFFGLKFSIKLMFRMNLRFRMNLCPKLHMLPCLFGLFRSLFVGC